MTTQGSPLEASDEPTQVQPGELSVDAGSVLAGEEQRTRLGALRAVFVALLIFIGVISFMPDKTGLTWLLVGVYGFVALVAGGLMLVSRKRRYGSGVSTVIGVMVVVLVLGSCVYFGVVGGPVIILPPVVYYYGLGDSKSRRRWVAGAAMLGYAVLVALVAAGVVPPTGMIPPDRLIRGDFLFISGLSVLALLAVTYWLSSLSRRSTLLAMAELESARRGIRQRDALLHEARDDLDRVVLGVRVGRLTGRSVDGFRIGSVIGRGAMGEVYQAEAAGSDQQVAFKVLHPHLNESRGQVERFFREAEITAALESPHIPKILGSGIDPDGAPYLVMELLHGRDLASELRQRKALSLTEIDLLVEQVCLALHDAHQAGVVHRDIKPQNLFLASAPAVTWKVLDFGVSKIASGSGTLTQGGAVGTPAYMAPEQASGANVDRRADVFSLGAAVYRALTGRPAFLGTSHPATVYATMHCQPIQPSELVDVPEDIDAVLALALAKKPSLRLPSARDFASAWASARQQRLDPELRAAARRLLTAHPWGTDYTKLKRLSGT